MANLYPIEQFYDPATFTTQAPRELVSLDGVATIKMIPSTPPGLSREVNGNFYLNVEPGDRLLFTLELCVGPSSRPNPNNSYGGIRPGIDFYGSGGYISGVSYDPKGSLPTVPANRDPTNQAANYVPYNSAPNFQIRKIDLKVPAYYPFMDDGELREVFQIVPWVQVYGGYGNADLELAVGYFRRTEFYKNETALVKILPRT